MYVRAATAGDAKHKWRPSCFLLNHGGGTLGFIKSPVCNYDQNKKNYIDIYTYVFNHGPLSASHIIVI